MFIDTEPWFNNNTKQYTLFLTHFFQIYFQEKWFDPIKELESARFTQLTPINTWKS